MLLPEKGKDGKKYLKIWTTDYTNNSAYFDRFLQLHIFLIPDFNVLVKKKNDCTCAEVGSINKSISAHYRLVMSSQTWQCLKRKHNT